MKDLSRSGNSHGDQNEQNKAKHGSGCSQQHFVKNLLDIVYICSGKERASFKSSKSKLFYHGLALVGLLPTLCYHIDLRFRIGKDYQH